MKKITLLIIIFVFSAMMYSQIGIYADSPLGIFHIDPLKNSTQLGNNIEEDIIISTDGNIGMGVIPQANASLTFGGLNKGFIMPFVTLKSNQDALTVPVDSNQDRGMIVYHSGGGGMETGLKVWTGSLWEHYLTKIELNGTNISLLNNNVDIVRTKTMTTTNTILPFQKIVVQTPGNYRFTIRIVVEFSNIRPLATNCSFVYRFNLLETTPGGVTQVSDSYQRYVSLVNNQSGGYTYLIEFDCYASNVVALTEFNLQVNTQFITDSDLNDITTSRWSTTYGPTTSRIIYQKID